MKDQTVSRIQPRRRSALYREVVGALQMAAEVVLLFLIFSAMLGGFEIEQNSMDPTFHPGQRVIVSKLGSVLPSWLVTTAQAAEHDGHTPFAPYRGQIVVFRSLSEADQTLIKRVIAVPGDQLELRDGAVFVNGQRLDEPYIHGQTTTCQQYCAPLTLGAGQYFMMGDNRGISLDSRSFGPVPAEKLVGRVLLRYWPLDEMALFGE